MPRRPSSTSASRASASASSQVIANIERVSMLFLTKTVYATLLAVLFGILVLEFPFLPRQLSITDGLTIGIPAFFLALMPNAQRYIPGFLRRSLSFAIPAGIVVAATITTYTLLERSQGIGIDEVRTGATIVLAVGIWILGVLDRPLNRYKGAVVGAMFVALIVIFTVPLARAFFLLVDPGPVTAVLVTGACLVAVCLIEIVRLVQRRYVARTLVDASAHPTVPHPQAVSRPVPVTLAVVAVYLGGLASARGSGLSRLFVTLLAAALIVLQAWTLALAREWSWWVAAQIVVYLLVLIALWAPPPGAARRVRVAPGEGCTPGEGGAGARAARQSVQARPARRLVIRSISADWVARIDSATCSVRGSLPRSRRASAIGTAPSWWRIISRRNVQSAAVPDSARSWARSAALAIPIWVMSSASDAGADPPPCS